MRDAFGVGCLAADVEGIFKFEIEVEYDSLNIPHY